MYFDYQMHQQMHRNCLKKNFVARFFVVHVKKVSLLVFFISERTVVVYNIGHFLTSGESDLYSCAWAFMMFQKEFKT